MDPRKLNLPDKSVLTQFAGVRLNLHSPHSLLVFCLTHFQDLATARGLSIRLINSNTIVQAYEDKEYADLLNHSGINVIDGLPLSILVNGALLRRPSRVRGPSFFRYVLSQKLPVPHTHVLVGSSQETLRILSAQIGKGYPNAKILGVLSPPFKSRMDVEDLEQIVTFVDKKSPTFTWIGLGTPKQDFVAHYISKRSKTIAVGVGAAFDFVAGTKSEAPAIIQSIGLEWLFRLLSEPRRLGKRYLVGNIKFLIIIFCRRVQKIPEL